MFSMFCFVDFDKKIIVESIGTLFKDCKIAPDRAPERALLNAVHTGEPLKSEGEKAMERQHQDQLQDSHGIESDQTPREGPTRSTAQDS